MAMATSKACFAARACLVACCLSPAGCGATDVALRYQPSAVVVPAVGAPVIGAVMATDDRHEDGHYLGTIRGGYGNPVKTIRTSGLTSVEAANAFRDALAARSLLGSPDAAPDTFLINIVRMDVNQVARREAHVELRVAVVDAANVPLYQDSVRTEQVNGSLLSLNTGIFGDTEALRALLSRTLNEAVDQALDKPGFREAVRAR